MEESVQQVFFSYQWEPAENDSGSELCDSDAFAQRTERKHLPSDSRRESRAVGEGGDMESGDKRQEDPTTLEVSSEKKFVLVFGW